MDGKFDLMTSLGNQINEESPKSLLKSLTHVVKMAEHVPGEMQNLSAKSSLTNHNCSRMRTNKNRSFQHTFWKRCFVLEALEAKTRLLPHQKTICDRHGLTQVKIT